VRFRLIRLGLLAGLLAPLLLSALLIGLTLAERDYLESVRWSPVRRNQIEWPSLLASGHWGWFETATLPVCAGLAGLFALSLYRLRSDVWERLGAILLMIMSLSLGLVAFPADRPGAGETSWHAQIHNAAYPAIPAAAVLASVVLARGWSLTGARVQALISAVTALVAVVSLAASLADAVAQASRYFLFGAILAWFEVVAVSTMRERRAGPASAIEPPNPLAAAAGPEPARKA